MAKQKVFIVILHKNSLKKGSRTEWEVQETVEFVNQLRNKHIQYATAIGDYIEKKMISGSRYGMDSYDKFEEYVRAKYKDQMKQLDGAFRALQADPTETSDMNVIVDGQGNVRARTVFDPIA